MITYHLHDTLQNAKFKIKNKRILNSWIKEIISEHQYKVGDINIILVDDQEILRINKEYLSHNYYTDIITFDTSEYDEDLALIEESTRVSRKVKSISSDIFISVDTVRENAGKYNVDELEELHRVIIHGILHLIGYDDHDPKDKEKMREAERTSLTLLRNKYGI